MNGDKTNSAIEANATQPLQIQQGETKQDLNIVHLPDVVLCTIFSFLDTKALGRVCCTCSRLREVASRDCVWLNESQNHLLMVHPGDRTSKSSPRYKSGHNRIRRVTVKDRCRIGKNWKDKNFQDVQFIKHSTKLMPWVKLHKQKLYVSNAGNINCYLLFNDGTVKEEKQKQINGGNHDVTKFVVTDNMIVSGFRGGGISGYDISTNKRLFKYEFGECNDTHAVDVYDDILVAGFRDGSLKVINTTQEEESGITTLHGNQHENRKPNRVWSVAISPDSRIFTVGNAGLEQTRTPIEVHDLESCKMLYSLGVGSKVGAGVLDIKYETPHTMLTCGYDTGLRLWDLRTQTCVKEWIEPYDVELSSLQTDGNHFVVTGTFQHGKSCLWDKRLDEPVEMYYCGKKRSPVYCLDTDFQRLFVALDYGIHMLDFTTYKTQSK